MVVMNSRVYSHSCDSDSARTNTTLPSLSSTKRPMAEFARAKFSPIFSSRLLLSFRSTLHLTPVPFPPTAPSPSLWHTSPSPLPYTLHTSTSHHHLCLFHKSYTVLLLLAAGGETSAERNTRHTSSCQGGRVAGCFCCGSGCRMLLAVR